MEDLLAAWLGVVRPGWMRDALCREHPELDWFPQQGASLDSLRSVCDACLVRAECRDYADAELIEHGVWAGLSARERVRHRHAGQRAA